MKGKLASECRICFVQGMDTTQQSLVDEKLLDLDGTSNKSKLGANAVLGVSLAVCRVSFANLFMGTKQ